MGNSILNLSICISQFGNVCACSVTHQGFRFFQDWWAEVTHGAKNDELFSEMMGPSISN